MQKSSLERLITKYNLAGRCEIVELVVANGTLTVKCLTENAFVSVSTNQTSLPDGSYTIIDTQQLRSLLGVLDDDITVKVIQHIDELIALEFRDKVTKVRFALGDPIMLPKLPKLLVEDTELALGFDDTFITTFIRAQSALSDAENFAVISIGDSVSVVVGYSENQNSNEVTIGAQLIQGSLSTPLFYNAKLFRDILMANRESTHGEVYIGANGLAHITFDLDEFTTDYYLLPTDND